ncbi:MAG: GNAT family N-acetyltransferase [Acidobacteria bacterium]|nr:GNAT family N-acetyltransferase [Acidobacteriota bacterium]
MRWKFSCGTTKGFREVRKEWDSINRFRGNHILLDSGFVEPLIRHFGGGQDLVLGMNDSSCMALLNRSSQGRWTTFQPSQSPLGLIVSKQPDAHGDELVELLQDLPGFVLQLSVTQQDPEYAVFLRGNEPAHIETLDYIQTARLPLIGAFEDYWQSRGKNLRHNLSRQRRRIEEKRGVLELVAERTASNMGACIREYGRLESEGWKGTKGTAVSEGNSQGGFYREILEHFCRQGEGIVYQLKLDGKVIASDLCLCRNGMLVVLKTAYDESIEGVSPALLLRQECVRQSYEEKQIRLIEFYGKVRDWHTKWTNDFRIMYHINVFRNRWLARSRKLIKRCLSSRPQ